MNTWVSDNFPLKELECQYFDICRHYTPGECPYRSKCPTRQTLRGSLEPYVAKENLRVQIELILDD